MREFAEELLGREDLEQMSDESNRAVDLLHQERTPPALGSVLDNPGALHLRLTGFGLNLLSGTYLAACLIVVEDENWWGEWGHELVGNWETTSIDCYSSADPGGLSALMLDPRWSSEGLFSLLEGLDCLSTIDDTGRAAF